MKSATTGGAFGNIGEVRDACRQVRTESAEIVRLCFAAGRPNLAAQLILAATPIEEVRRALAATHPAPPTPGAFGLADIPVRDQWGRQPANPAPAQAGAPSLASISTRLDNAVVIQ
jgi:hypothetical protein